MTPSGSWPVGFATAKRWSSHTKARDRGSPTGAAGLSNAPRSLNDHILVLSSPLPVMWNHRMKRLATLIVTGIAALALTASSVRAAEPTAAGLWQKIEDG